MIKNGLLPKELIRKRIEEMTHGVEPDKRFVYHLMGATGIVVVPLSGFQCNHNGFRATLLEADESKRAWILDTLRRSIDEYVASSSKAEVAAAKA